MDSDAKQNMQQLEQLVRATYFAERRRFAFRTTGHTDAPLLSDKHIASWDGGVDARGRRCQPIWPKIVKFAAARRLNPVELIKAVFASWTAGKPPLPTMFVSEEAATLARAHCSDNLDYLKQRLKAQKREVFQQMMIKRRSYPDKPHSELWRDVLTSPVLTSGPLFRYALACDLGLCDLANSLVDAARAEYLQNPDEYDSIFIKADQNARVVGNYLPPIFREESRRCLTKLLADGQ